MNHSIFSSSLREQSLYFCLLHIQAMKTLSRTLHWEEWNFIRSVGEIIFTQFCTVGCRSKSGVHAVDGSELQTECYLLSGHYSFIYLFNHSSKISTEHLLGERPFLRIRNTGVSKADKGHALTELIIC